MGSLASGVHIVLAVCCQCLQSTLGFSSFLFFLFPLLFLPLYALFFFLSFLPFFGHAACLNNKDVQVQDFFGVSLEVISK